MTKLMVAFLATLRMHLNLMVFSSSILVEIRIFFSVISDALSKCPTLLIFFSNRNNTAHTSVVSVQRVIKLNLCAETAALVRGLTLQITGVLNRCYNCSD